MKPKISMPIIALFCSCSFGIAQSRSSDHPVLPTDPGEPLLLTEEMISDLPFVKPTMTLQKALKIAEANLGKDVLRKRYFLFEAKMIDPQNGPAFNWHFKWIRHGVRQRDNTPLEVAVTSDGHVVKNSIREE